METLYNKNGEPIAYVSDDNEHIYQFNGQPVAYLKDENIYNYYGRYLGWKYDGWYFDRNGHRAFFKENAVGGPIKPIKKIKPIKAIKNIRPIKSIKEIRPIKPIRSLSWSSFQLYEYFFQ